MLIKRDNIHEAGPFKFSAEASDLGLKPGKWPTMMDCIGIGNGMPFMRKSKKVDEEGELLWVTYDQVAGCVSLRVFND